jgi:hypothetical protein
MFSPALALRSTGDTGNTMVLPIGPNLVAARIYETQYVFETRTLMITASSRGRKPMNLTVNKQTQLAIEKQSAYVIDDDGKELKLNIIGKRAK